MTNVTLDTFPVGIALPFFGTKDLIPEGWTIYDGSEFNKVINPINGLIFPEGKFPNFAGRVPEGFIDDDHGHIGSEQAGEVISHGHNATSTFTGTAKAPTATFKGNAASHQHFSVAPLAGEDHAIVPTDNAIGATGHHNEYYSLAGSTSTADRGKTNPASITPSGTVTVNSYTPAGTVSTSVSASGGTRNTVDRIVCYWIGKLG